MTPALTRALEAFGTYSSERAAQVINNNPKLSPTAKEVLVLIRDGKSTKEIEKMTLSTDKPGLLTAEERLAVAQEELEV